MTIIRKKIAMLGAFGVGKTSLVRRFVSNEFSEDYVSTLGVRIEKRRIDLEQSTVELLIWDIAGDDEFVRLRSSYLRGASGLLLVADASRAWTADKLLELREQADSQLSGVPRRALLNKSDLPVDPLISAKLKEAGFPHAVHTSAKTGSNVAEVFLALAREVVSG